MSLPPPRTLSEAAVRKQLEDLKDSSAQDAFEWLLDAAKAHPSLVPSLAEVFVANLRDGTPSLEIQQCLNVLEKNTKSCPPGSKTVNDHQVYSSILSLLVQARPDDALNSISEQFLDKLRDPVYSHDLTLSSVIDQLKERVLPTVKDHADCKQYKKALRMWRAIVKFTRLEKLPTAVTNKILLIATMAFKESNAEVHINAFKSWAVLIDSLPKATLKKTAYVRLLLNPLNRTYNETESLIASHKYESWWHLVTALGAEVNPHFDEVVFNLLQKVFNVPSAKARQLNPAVSLSTERPVTAHAYDVLLKLLDNGGCVEGEIAELKALPQPLNDACFAKHATFLSDIFNMILNNLEKEVTPPPEGYAHKLCEVLFARTTALHNGEHHALLRVFLVAIFKFLQKNTFSADQTLKLYSDMTNGIPQKVMVSSQFNLREGSFNMHECPLIIMTEFLIESISHLCLEERQAQYRLLLKVLLERGGTSGLNVVLFISTAMRSLTKVHHALRVDTWIEIASFLGQSLESATGIEDEETFSSCVDVLVYPFRTGLSGKGMAERWVSLFAMWASGVSGSAGELVRELSDKMVADVESDDATSKCVNVLREIVDAVEPEELEEGAHLPDRSRSETLVALMAVLAEHVSSVKEHSVRVVFLESVADFVEKLSHDGFVQEAMGQIVAGAGKSAGKSVAETKALDRIARIMKRHDKSRKGPDSSKKAPSAEGDRTLDPEGPHGATQSPAKRPPVTPRGKRSSRVPTKNEKAETPALNVSTRSSVSLAVLEESRPARRSLRHSTRKTRGDETPEKSVKPRMSRRSRTAASTSLVSQSPTKDEPEPETKESRKTDTSERPEENGADLSGDLSEEDSRKRAMPEPLLGDTEVIDEEMATESTNVIQVSTVGETKDLVDGLDPEKDTSSEADSVQVVPEAEVSEVSEDRKTDGVEIGDSEEDVEVATESAESMPPTSVTDAVVALKTEASGIPPTVDISDGNEENDEPSSKRLRTSNGHVSPLKTSETKVAAPVGASPLPNGARKRKLGQMVQSPVAAKLQQKKLLANSPSSRSHRLLEAAKAINDSRSSNAGSTPRKITHRNVIDSIDHASLVDENVEDQNDDGDTTMDITSRSILKRTSSSSRNRSVSFSDVEEPQECASLKGADRISDIIEEPPVAPSSREEPNESVNVECFVEMQVDAESPTVTTIAPESLPQLVQKECQTDLAGDPCGRLAELISASGTSSRADMLNYLGSEAFLKSLTSEERKLFSTNIFNSIAQFIH